MIDDNLGEVWVFAEQQDGKIKDVAYELASEGRRLADKLKTKLCVVCFGHAVEGIEKLVASGVDKVYSVDDSSFADNQEDLCTKELADLVLQFKPEVLLAGATPLGRSFIPRVAAVLETGLAADCTALEIDADNGLLLQKRPAYGGNLLATIVCQRKPQIATVRPHTFKKGPLDESRQGEIIKVDFNKESITSKTKLIEVLKDVTERIKLEDADIIVCGGRGLGEPKNFEILAELADVLDAALGSSRPPVDDGWIPYSHQVGQTGKTVSPKLYIACGISGAPQHLTGMQTAETIVAVNEDPRAPIFEVATYGIVGDLFKIVPMLTERLRGIRS